MKDYEPGVGCVCVHAKWERSMCRGSLHVCHTCCWDAAAGFVFFFSPTSPLKITMIYLLRTYLFIFSTLSRLGGA